MIKEKFADRVLGTLYGVAVGDALGMPTEFLSREQVKDIYGWVDEYRRTPSWHPLAHLPAGSITDDTEQSIAMGEMVIKNKEFTTEDVVEALFKWAKRGKLEQGLDAMGPSTLRALNSLEEGAKPTSTGLMGNTNGAAIRISPLAVAYPGLQPNLIEQVVTLCVPTHFTDIAISGGSAIAYWISAALAGADLKGALDAALKGAVLGREAFKKKINLELGGTIPWEVMSAQVNPYLEDRIRWAVEIATAEAPWEERYEKAITSLGTSVDMIQTVPISIAFAIIAEGDPFKAVCLGANAGGDTDSIASVAGALAGALGGASGFPRNLIDQLEEVNGIDLKTLAEQLIETADLSALEAQGGETA
ncbi:MAG TPA: hypothetical protein GX521_06170 [Firmicutes bacterium]|nr:hypothetical protein [Bacillota bacterium]